MAETDWTALGAHLTRVLGVVAREHLDLHGDEAYGEALRMLVAAGHLVTVEEHHAAVARSDRVAEGNRVLVEDANRRWLMEVTELRDSIDRKVAERMAGLAEELRIKADHVRLAHHVRRGVLLAADWLAAPADQLAAVRVPSKANA